MAQDPTSFPSGTNPFGSGQPQSTPNNAVPPPPSSDQQIGVRTMQSDAASIKQMGGGSPEPQIMSASEVFGASTQPTPSPAQSSSGGSASQPPFASYQYGVPSAPAVGDTATSLPPQAKSSKTIFVILGIIVLAVIVGFGVFYLVSALNQSTPVTPTPTSSGALSAAVDTSTASITTPSPMPASTPAPIVHTSLIPSPDSSVTLALTGSDVSSFQSAIASSSKNTLLAGTVRDIAFTDASGTPITSDVFLQAFLPSAASSLSSFFEKDFTTWLYGDKSGGSKLGVVLTLNTATTPDQVAAAFTLMEGSPQDVPQFFLSPVTLPTPATFKGGLIGGLMVRYLVFSIKNQQVFEYTPAVVNGRNVLIITTSYNQMVDILKRLSAQPIATSTPTPTLSATPTPSLDTATPTPPMASPSVSTSSATQ